MQQQPTKQEQQVPFIPIKKSQRKIEGPVLQFDQFLVGLVTEQNYEEAFNCFCLGYHLNHPFFKALGASLDDIKLQFKQKYRTAFEERPLQQHVVYDTKKQNKIVGTFLSQHFMDIAEKEELGLIKQLEKNAQNSICETKYRYDMKLLKPEIIKPYVDEINATKNPMLYQQVSISILPEYMQYGFFQKMLALNFYTCQKLGVKAYIDLIFNKVTGHVSLKYCNGKILNDLDIRNETHQGQHLFTDDMCRGQLIQTPLVKPDVSKFTLKSMNNDKAFSQWYEQAENYFRSQRNGCLTISELQQQSQQRPRL